MADIAIFSNGSPVTGRLQEKCRKFDLNLKEQEMKKYFKKLINNNNNKFFIADNCPYTHIKKHLKYKHIYINNAFHWELNKID